MDKTCSQNYEQQTDTLSLIKDGACIRSMYFEHKGMGCSVEENDANGKFKHGTIEVIFSHFHVSWVLGYFRVAHRITRLYFWNQGM